ncbi:hypothetical protein ASC90_27335 [Rhizobium sp. Root1220]|nr:hypothetical protein ASC90_27335 [Rhizobium sp. Root1220]
MKPGVMSSAQPPDPQRLVVLVMMGINSVAPADFTCLLFQLACLHSALHGKVSIVFGGVGPTPVRLAGIGFQHRAILPCKVCDSRRKLGTFANAYST